MCERVYFGYSVQGGERRYEGWDTASQWTKEAQEREQGKVPATSQPPTSFKHLCLYLGICISCFVVTFGLSVSARVNLLWGL